MGRSHYQLAELLLTSKSPIRCGGPEAETAKEPVPRGASKIRPDSEPVSDVSLEDQILLGQALIAAGRLSDAMAAAEELPALQPSDPSFYVHAVGLLIQCADSQRRQRARAGKQAEDMPGPSRRTSFARPYKHKVIRLKTTLEVKDFDPLRERDDFKQLRDLLDDSVHIG